MRVRGQVTKVTYMGKVEGSVGLVNGLLNAGVKVVSHIVDVSDAAAVNSAVDDVISRFGSVDFLINNAGVSPRNSILETSPEELKRAFDVNVWGIYNCSRPVLRSMVEKKSGKIINLASWVGKTAHPEYFAYCTSKFAVIGMTQSMAFDLGKFGITVNAICPGVIMNTGLRNAAEADAARRGLPVANQRLDGIPLRRTGEPSDIANTIMFLLSDQGDYMTGQSLNVTGGLWMN